MSGRWHWRKIGEPRDFWRDARLAANCKGIVLVPLLVVTPAAAIAQEIDAGSLSLLGTGKLSRDLTPLGMFLSADLVVKVVLLALVLASIVTWTVWLAKTIELVIIRRRLRAAMKLLASARSTAEAAERTAGSTSVVTQCVDVAANELKLCDAAMGKRGIKERIAARLERIEAMNARTASRGIGVLATIGATAPFVGLFGTVWGIMNSFVGISQSQTTNLAVVAPGIAEALLATAFGLAAAIPAVVIYNVFARTIAGYRLLVADASAELMRMVSRQLDRETNETTLVAAETPDPAVSL